MSHAGVPQRYNQLRQHDARHRTSVQFRRSVMHCTGIYGVANDCSPPDASQRQLEGALQLYYQDGNLDVLITRTWQALRSELMNEPPYEKELSTLALGSLSRANGWPTSSSALCSVFEFCRRMEGNLGKIEPTMILAALSLSCYLSKVRTKQDSGLLAGFLSWEDAIRLDDQFG